MGTIEQKLNKIIQTKNRLRANINGLGGGLTESSKFSDYPLALSQLYSRLPKTSYQEGTNINLGKTLKATVQYEDDIVGYGDTSQDGTPTPESPIPIQVVTGTQEIAVKGKNLFDNSVERKNAFPNTIVGQQMGYNNSSATYSYVNCAYLQKGTTYTLSWKQSQTSASTNQRISALIDSNNIILETITTWLNGQTSITFTPNNSGWLVLATDIYATEIQIESGSATSYEPYITPTTYQVHLGSLELAKIGDYQDYIYFDVDEGKWYKKGYIGTTILNGTELYWQASISGSRYSYWFKNTDIGCLNEICDKYCNYFSYEEQPFSSASIPSLCENTLINPICMFIFNTNGTQGSNLTAFKDWLSQNNVTLKYPLATSISTEITDTTLIQDLDNIYGMNSNEGTTIIEVSGNLPAPIKVRAVKGE